MSLAKYNRRVGDLEFRFMSEERFPEIVAWQPYGDKESCYTLLRWAKNSEGWDVKFIGNRPFVWNRENFTANHLLWSLMEYAQKLLDAEFQFEEQTQ